MLELPNIPHPAVPVGPDETANVVVREEGEVPLPSTAFQPRPHWELGAALGIIDFERGVKISGSRFYVLTGAGARLQRALITWMLDLHVGEHGYTEVYPPAMVKRECLVGTGTLPKFGDTMYRDIEDDLWFIPTAEVPVTNLTPRGDLRARTAAGLPRRLHRASGARRCRPAATYAASSAGTSSTRARWSSSSRRKHRTLSWSDW
jgi:seryl-tRNA synthetase